MQLQFPFRFTVEGSDEQIRVQSFSGTEALSTPYQFHIDLLLPLSYPFESMLGKKGCLIVPGRQATRNVHGVIFRVQTIANERTPLENYVVNRVVLTPPLLRLSLNRNLRIYQHKTTRQVVTDVLQKGGIQTEVEWKLKANYTPRDYCVQYREQDLEFISRLLEEEGITYYFEHSQDHLKMVCTDDVSGFRSISESKTDAAIAYTPEHGMSQDLDSIWDLTFRKDLRPHQVTLRDYSFKSPRLDVGATAAAQEAAGQIYDYPAECVDTDLASRLAKVRLEELQATKFTGHGHSNCNRLVPGLTFDLGDAVHEGLRYPREDLNQEYLVESVNHAGGALGYSNDFLAVPTKDKGNDGAAVLYRPSRVTPRPIVLGLHSAEVVGKAGEEIDVDSFGRVKVRFRWDRGGGVNPDSSCWIRVAQAWAGARWGAIFIPRVGQEVLVQFLEGDPDRPVIVGQTYNGSHPVPYDLPKSKTISTIMTSSSPGNNGHNELRFEDAAGSEEVYIRAQKDSRMQVGHDWETEVVNDAKHSAKTISLTATDRIEIQVGNSKVVLTPDRISITAPDIDAVAQNVNDIKGGMVKLNC